MKKFLSVLIIGLMGACFATNSVTVFKSGVAKRAIPLALGAAKSVQLTGTATSTLNVTTEGFGDLYQVVTLGHTGAAVSTVNVIVGGQPGDVIVLQTKTATEDVVILDTTGINIGGNRTLSDPADKLMLFRRDASNWDELGFDDNN